MRSFRHFLVLVLCACAFAACDEDTASIGGSVMPEYDHISASTANFAVLSSTIQTDSVLANTNNCYLGSIVDPVTRLRTNCNFLAQFHLPENFTFPPADRIAMADDGRVLVDSCCLRLYFNTYYGDSLTTMKMRVQELDTANVMEEGKLYYTDIDPQQYVSPTSPYQGEMTYTVRDLTRSLSTDKASFKGNIVVNLSPAYGRFLIEKYFENPAFYSNSYNFIRHVCPGFYFETAGGVGSMVNIVISALDVYFRYHTTNELGNDTIVEGMQRLAATEEVIQNSSVETKVPTALLTPQPDCSYVSSPAGLFTELELPVAEAVAGEHYNDSINGAKLSLPCLTEDTGASTAFPVPSTLLLVRKADMYKFFETQTVADGVTSYIAEYASNLNAYVFSNIASLMTIIKNERDKGAGVVRTESEDVRNAKYAAWEAENPDWNKVVVIPVAADYGTTSVSGTSVRTLLRVRNELGLSCAKLQGGTGGNLTLGVMYSSFE